MWCSVVLHLMGDAFLARLVDIEVVEDFTGRFTVVNWTRATQASSPIDHAAPAPTETEELLEGIDKFSYP